jgi:hypothetical protein
MNYEAELKPLFLLRRGVGIALILGCAGLRAFAGLLLVAPYPNREQILSPHSPSIENV